MLSDALYSFGAQTNEEDLAAVAYGCLSPLHAQQFKAFIKQVRRTYRLEAILKGDMAFPRAPEERDVLYFLAQSFRARLLKELPEDKGDINPLQRDLAYRAKGLLKELAQISLEIAQMVVSNTDNHTLPGWFMIEVVRDLPRLVERQDG
jgi:hypothetical protein